MNEESEYIMIESGKAPIIENNLMPHIVLLSEGEVEYTNKELQSFGSTQLYVKLIKGEESE